MPGGSTSSISPSNVEVPQTSLPVASASTGSPTLLAGMNSLFTTAVNAESSDPSSRTAGRGGRQTRSSLSSPPVPSAKASGPDSPSPHGAPAVPDNPSRSTLVGPIVGVVSGCLAAIALGAVMAMCVIRRRRRRRAKEAMLASGPLDWWRRRPHTVPNREPSERSTVVVDDVDDLETLDCGDMSVDEKKSVTYGEYPY
ncbi:hypothetical protein BV20DRAFT_656095 [Pilatotrama ljubarskyi]|nr:hypothetical protein BV20DRAFT_656095 [Pilatotrama ljubarskyi]